MSSLLGEGEVGVCVLGLRQVLGSDDEHVVGVIVLINLVLWVHLDAWRFVHLVPGSLLADLALDFLVEHLL